jgi:hypothetical protein
VIALGVIAAMVLLVTCWTCVTISQLHSAASRLYLLDIGRDTGDPISVRDVYIREKQATRV